MIHSRDDRSDLICFALLCFDLMSSEMTTVERRATRASTRNGGGNGRARVDGRDATRTKIYAAEDGSRPVGKKRERGGDDATTRTRRMKKDVIDTAHEAVVA